MEWPRVSVGSFTTQKFIDGLVRQIARRDDMWHCTTKKAAGAPALCQMHFDERAMCSSKAAKRTQRLYHARASRPAAAGPSAQRDHRDGS